jgi:hypothetical protein
MMLGLPRIPNFIQNLTTFIKMFKQNLYIPLLFALGFFGSCQNTNPETADSTEEATKESCYYQLVEDSTYLQWTAYKTNDRIPVSGTFNVMEVNTQKKADSPLELMQNANFKVDANSVYSGNPIRDPKLVEFFFALIENAAAIRGEIETVEGSESEGKGSIKLMFNGLSKNVDYSYQIIGEKIELQIGLNMGDWNGTGAINSLNEACYELHKGADGESRLWADVVITVKAQYQKPC